MATIWVCPIDGSLPADNGSNSNTVYSQGNSSAATLRAEDSEWVVGAGSQVNLNGAAALGDYNGLPPHCPICGAAVIVVNTTTVTTVTGVASGSQHPADVDATYVTAADSPLAQGGATAYALQGQYGTRQPHGYKGSTNRGTATVTAETINSTVGP